MKFNQMKFLPISLEVDQTGMAGFDRSVAVARRTLPLLKNIDTASSSVTVGRRMKWVVPDMFELCQGVMVRVVGVIQSSWARIHAHVEFEVGPHTYTNFPSGNVVFNAVENVVPSLTVRVLDTPRVKSRGGAPVTPVSAFERPARKSIRLFVDVGSMAVTDSAAVLSRFEL